MEETVAIPHAGTALLGVLHLPETPLALVIMVTGGPQSRVGSHRLYVRLARRLRDAGYACLRFDLQGMGDSPGEFLGYHRAAISIRSALEFAAARFPRLVPCTVWSLCDGAAATAAYARHDSRISGLVLCNPYIYSDKVRSQTYLRHYYLAHLRDAEFWKRLFKFQVNPWRALTSLASLARKALSAGPGSRTAAAPEPAGCFAKADVEEEVLRGIGGFPGPVHFLLSGEDLTAKAFEDAVTADPALRGQLAAGRLSIGRIAGADHTFSSGAFKEQVLRETLRALASPAPRPSLQPARSQ